ncbi:1-phosphatidylinositol phosphodiesterase [Octopus bimaculoides]|uniref:Phosphatidylinositol-specific phospholipase C X domain-containing protein n=1 Tax=Octopus bimaculoides TaxID=37653 RepID=A0A0L8FWT8_OCTBM|nr:1-phosphatidylinositol phosphodiesterase [Octopus bimaculoides]|eukprot:XP_014786398.1 PREDICTED: 1-phosphatidylinositol phosphodiesterase-like [Octopus bimaculoides]
MGSGFSEPETNFPNWMSTISDQTSVAHLTVPGTHNTMAFYGGSLIACQYWELYPQLLGGIRFLDIRCRHFRNGLHIHHGVKYQYADIDTVLRNSLRFLTDYPTETIFMRIKEEYETVENNRSYEETLKVSIQRYIENGRISSSFSSIPKLGDIRGKIVILQNFPGSAYGLNYNGGLFSIEDHWYVPTILYSHIEEKWQHVKRQLDTSGADEGSSVIYVTFTSGASSGAYPNAVADRINPQLENYLEEKKPKKRFGFISIDFPSSALIGKIIQCNH